jgi:hypothetical protein
MDFVLLGCNEEPSGCQGCHQPRLLPPVRPGANPAIASYNASVVKIYSASNSMARFYNKNYFLLI